MLRSASLRAGCGRGRLRGVEVALRPHQLRPVHPADPGEHDRAGRQVAPPLGDLGPPAGPRHIAQVRAERDHLAVEVARLPRSDPARQDRQHRLVQQSHPRAGSPPRIAMMPWSARPKQPSMGAASSVPSRCSSAAPRVHRRRHRHRTDPGSPSRAGIPGRRSAPVRRAGGEPGSAILTRPRAHRASSSGSRSRAPPSRPGRPDPPRGSARGTPRRSGSSRGSGPATTPRH